MNIFDSQFLLRKFIQAFPDLARQAIVIPPGLEPFFFTQSDDATIEELRDRFAVRGRRVVLSVGRLAEGKGFPHLVRLFGKVVEKVPDAVLLIAGDGPKRDLIAEQIEKAGLQNVIRLVGRIPREELPAFYAMADVFALLTHANEGKEEGFGLVFAEAGALGVPVVAGQCGGVEEVVAHEETGIIVNTYMDDEVVHAIVRLLTDKETAKRFGERGRERARELFRIEEVVRRLTPWIE
jgi:phosphatidylinositol alpha-1,6-mannosyltransferase